MSEETKKGAVIPAPSPSEVEVLKAQLADQKKAYDALSDKLEEAVQEVEAAREIIDELKEELKGNSSNQKGPTGKVGKDSYRVVGGYRTKDKVFTPQDIAADPQLLKSLVENGSTLVQKL